MILFLAYLAVVLSLSSALLALLIRQQAVLATGFVKARDKGVRLPPAVEKFLVDALSPTRFQSRLQQLVFLCLGLAGLSAILSGLSVLVSDSIVRDQLVLGLPWLPWHVRLDSLSGFFYLIIGLAVAAVSLFGPGYVKDYDEQEDSFTVLGLFTGIFIAGMFMVLLADDAFFFMIAWELMSVASYFLVSFQHQEAANRRAAFLYLIMAEVGAIAIILGFGVIAGFSADYSFTFDAFRDTDLSVTWASVAFILALLGFGMKAGLVPIHVWLPEAHPVAPSHISALMSGVMLKVALYGFIRFCFELLGDIQWEWGVVLLVIGALSSLGGIFYAMMQNNLKRLLAYSSVENIGVIFMVLGLSMIFLDQGHPEIAALGFMAALFHAFNHALFKNLLFLGAGVIQHQVHSLNIDDMGGLIKRMPHTSKLFLVACMSIASLPLFNGFVSEWLAFQTALRVDVIDNAVLRSLIPVAAAALALTAALAAACFVNVYGVMFLGLPRSRHAEKAEETQDKGMLAALSLLAGLCFLVGVIPGMVISLLNNVSIQIIGNALPNVAAVNWFWLAPVSAEQASYAAPLVLFGVLLVGGVSFWYLRRNSALEFKRTETWDCGYGGLNNRMQYNSVAFMMPFRRIFANVWELDEKIDKKSSDVPQQVSEIRYQLQVDDHSWRWIYNPIERLVYGIARIIGRLQTGNIRIYLAYSFITLIFLLWVVS